MEINKIENNKKKQLANCVRNTKTTKKIEINVYLKQTTKRMKIQKLATDLNRRNNR